MKWIKASVRMPEKGKKVPLKFRGRYGCGNVVGSAPGYIVDDHSGTLDDSEVEWLDESPESPSPSPDVSEEMSLDRIENAAKARERVQESILAYHYNSFIGTRSSCKDWTPYESLTDDEKECVFACMTDYADQLAAVRGPILTRELHDKIWAAATKRNEHKHTQYRDAFNFTLSEKTIPDKETFYKSLNL